MLPGDTPLLRAETLEELVATHVASDNAATLLTSVVDDPTGYGRVIRGKDGNVLGIVEQRDATAEALAVNEISTSIYAFRRDLLGPALRRLSPDNAQGEYYLTDVVGSLAGMGHRVGSCRGVGRGRPRGSTIAGSSPSPSGSCRSRTNRYWLLNGVTMLDPRQTFIDVTVQLGRDITLYPGTMLHGSTRRRQRAATWDRTPDSSTARSARACRSSTPSPMASSSGPAPESGRTPRSPRVRRSRANEVTGPFYTGGSEHRGGA